MKKLASILLAGAIAFTPIMVFGVEKKITVDYGFLEVIVNGKKIEKPSILYQGVTYVPVAEITQKMGGNLKWVPLNDRIVITSGETVTRQTTEITITTKDDNQKQETQSNEQQNKTYPERVFELNKQLFNSMSLIGDRFESFDLNSKAWVESTKQEVLNSRNLIKQIREIKPESQYIKKQEIVLEALTYAEQSCDHADKTLKGGLSVMDELDGFQKRIQMFTKYMTTMRIFLDDTKTK